MSLLRTPKGLDPEHKRNGWLPLTFRRVFRCINKRAEERVVQMPEGLQTLFQEVDLFSA